MIRTFAIILVLSAPAIADTPLPLPENWQQTLPSGTTIDANVTRNTIVIAPANGPAWSVPFYTYAFGIHVSPDGQYALLPAGADGLLAWDQDPDMSVLHLYQAPGVEIGIVPLRTIVDPRDLEPTVSHYLWINNYMWSENGWAFSTPDRQAWHLSTDLTLRRR